MKKKILAVCLAAAACVLLSTTIQTKSMQQNMAQKVLRFHVLANSDSREDQALKLKVRDQVGTLMAEKLKDADSLKDSEQIVKANLNVIEDCAAKVISAEGYDYSVSAALENCMFPEKTYGAYTFPGGDYEALRVVIGSGEGHNWWCVLYPSLCYTDSLNAVVPESSKQTLSCLLDQDDYGALLPRREKDGKKPEVHVRFRLLDLLRQADT